MDAKPLSIDAVRAHAVEILEWSDFLDSYQPPDLLKCGSRQEAVEQRRQHEEDLRLDLQSFFGHMAALGYDDRLWGLLDAVNDGHISATQFIKPAAATFRSGYVPVALQDLHCHSHVELAWQLGKLLHADLLTSVPRLLDNDLYAEPGSGSESLISEIARRWTGRNEYAVLDFRLLAVLVGKECNRAAAVLKAQSDAAKDSMENRVAIHAQPTRETPPLEIPLLDAPSAAILLAVAMSKTPLTNSGVEKYTEQLAQDGVVAYRVSERTVSAKRSKLISLGLLVAPTPKGGLTTTEKGKALAEQLNAR
jgi:hypothetical protein